MKILLIDSDPAWRAVVREALHDYTIVENDPTAADCKLAIVGANHAGVIMALDMPVVVMTGTPNEAEGIRILRHKNVKGYHTKTHNVSEMRQVLVNANIKVWCAE